MLVRRSQRLGQLELEVRPFLRLEDCTVNTIEVDHKQAQRIAAIVAAFKAIPELHIVTIASTLEPVELQPEHHCTMDG